MVALYITAMGEAAGKSTLCAGLGRMLQADGKKVGFLKPVSSSPEGSDKDAELMKRLLALDEPVESLCPVSISASDLAATAEEQGPTWLKKVEEAYGKISSGKDVVLLEGLGGLNAGSGMARIAGRIAEALKAKAVMIVPYEVDVDCGRVADAARELGGSLLGVVVNAVPVRRLESVKASIVPALEQSGIRVLGVLPEDRLLVTITVGELAEHIGGTILNSQDRSDELVESLMVGALSFDSASSYLTTRDNKAVITRGDHADIQLAALNTSIKCLVLTDNIDPKPTIISRALELEVPIVLVEKDTNATIEAVENVLDKASLYHEGKIERLGRILEQNLDLGAVY